MFVTAVKRDELFICVLFFWLSAHKAGTVQDGSAADSKKDSAHRVRGM